MTETANAIISTTRNFVGWESTRGTAATLSGTSANLSLYSDLPFTNIAIESRPITVPSAVSSDFQQPESLIREDYIGNFSTGFIPSTTTGYDGTNVTKTQGTDLFLLSAMRSRGYFTTVGQLTAAAPNNTNVLANPRTIALYNITTGTGGITDDGLPPLTNTEADGYIAIDADNMPTGITRFVRMVIPDVWASADTDAALGNSLTANNLAGLVKNKFLKITVHHGEMPGSDFVVDGTRTLYIKAASFFRIGADLAIDMFPSHSAVVTNTRTAGLINTIITQGYDRFGGIDCSIVQASNVDSGLTFITESDVLEINTDNTGYLERRQANISAGHIISNFSLTYGQSTPVEMAFETRYSKASTGVAEYYQRTGAARDVQFVGNTIFPTGTNFSDNTLSPQTIESQTISTIAVRNFTISQFNGTGSTFDQPRSRNINCSRLVLTLASEVTPITSIDGVRRNPVNALAVTMEATITAETDRLYLDTVNNIDVAIDLEMFTVDSGVMYVLSIPRAKLRTANHVPVAQSNRREYRVQITSVPEAFVGTPNVTNSVNLYGNINNTNHVTYNNSTQFFNLYKLTGMSQEALQSDNFYSSTT